MLYFTGIPYSSPVIALSARVLLSSDLFSDVFSVSSISSETLFSSSVGIFSFGISSFDISSSRFRFSQSEKPFILYDSGDGRQSLSRNSVHAWGGDPYHAQRVPDRWIEAWRRRVGAGDFNQ